MEVITEEDRLSVVVREIDAAASIVPRGAYIVESAHNVVKNAHFEGLSNLEAEMASNYFHFRSSDASANLLNKKGLIASTDFLGKLF